MAAIRGDKNPGVLPSVERDKGQFKNKPKYKENVSMIKELDNDARATCIPKK